MHILFQGDFDEGFIQPHFWAIVGTLVILAGASLFAVLSFRRWLRNRPKRVEPAPRGFPVKMSEHRSE